MPMDSLSPGEDPEAQARGDSGVAGNERLTALTGAVLLVLFAAEIVTVVLLRGLMPVHFFVGVLLIGPMAVKTASTGWRFLRYYARDPVYRRKGPPRPAMRVLSPLLLASTLAVIASGIALAGTGPAPAVLLRIHVISFLAWLALIIVHVTVYAARVPKVIADDWRRRTARREQRTGRRARLAVNVAALAAAAIPAVAMLPSAALWAGWGEQGVSGFGILAVVAIAITGVVSATRRRRRRL
ncbi:hypothetical protein [Arthrobacter sp. AZCC_0090]|uniref:hypothetical protein n=1 Tax=Arthrobacter sp. AZCC_0090 TaxID=2735881 RepID=UPI00160D8BCB|nr:hypothetical protein [Arthrobacter sp. AZCC_0090]MBB6404198.1 hypothetical protein [Arthrobacter sp. AZCC_0090]